MADLDVKAMAVEIDKLRTLAKNLGNVLLRFTPGGSEYFVKVCGDYYADADACRAVIQRTFDNLNEHMRKSVGRAQDAEAALLSAHEAGRAAGAEWHPISEAPKDGTVVLVWAAPFQDLPGFQSTASYHPDAGWCVDELRDVTHFMPLPAPPKEASP